MAMGLRSGGRRYAMERRSTSVGISSRHLVETLRAPVTSSRCTQFQLSARYATQSTFRTRDLLSKDKLTTSIRHSKNQIGIAGNLARSQTSASTAETAQTEPLNSGFGHHNSDHKQQDLAWDLDESFPPQVRLCNWGLQALDTFNGVSESDWTTLQASVQRYTRALSSVDKTVNHDQRLHAELDLIRDFTDVWYRSAKGFKALSQEQSGGASSADDLDQLKKVFEVLEQLDTPTLDDQAISPEREILRAVIKDGLNEAEDTPDSVLGGNAKMNQNRQRDPREGLAALVDSTQRQPASADQTEFYVPFEPDAAKQTVSPEPATASSSPVRRRYVSEATGEWLRRQQLDQAVAKAHAEAQTKLREFQLREFRQSTDMSPSELQAAKAEYELAIDRHRRLASQLEKEDEVIIRHKPPKAAPVVIQSRRRAPPQLEVETVDIPEKPMQEEGIDTSYTAVAKVPPPQDGHMLSGEQFRHVEAEADRSWPAETHSTTVKPVKPLQKGWFASLFHIFSSSFAAVLPTSWKAGSSANQMTLPERAPPAVTQSLSNSNALESRSAIPSPKGSTPWTDRAKAASENLWQLMRSRRDRLATQAKAGVESTNWQSLGFANYGEWLATRLDRPISSREAAYITYLIDARRKSVFGERDSRDAWRTYIQSLDIDHATFANEIGDKRIRCHLVKLLPKRQGIIGATTDAQDTQRSAAQDIYERLLGLGDVMEVHTDASYLVEGTAASGSGGGIAIKTRPPIRESCQMGSIMLNSSEAEIGALYRGLQIVRNTLEKASKSVGDSPYRRVVFVTDSLNCLEAMTGFKVWSPHSKMTRMAALCRIEAYQILKANKNIEGIDFIWLPRMTAGNVIADYLAKLGRLSRFNFLDDDRGRL